MKELIKIEEAIISNEKVNAVSARELHKFLGSRQEFSTWVKARLEKNRFEEGFDFLITLSKTILKVGLRLSIRLYATRKVLTAFRDF